MKLILTGMSLRSVGSVLRSVIVRANEFVKKFGLEHTKYLIEDTELSEFAIHSSCAGKYSMDTVCVSDLKRLVESHEIVEYIGNDLDGAKQVYAFTKDCVHIAMRDRMIPVIRLKQAIADVESCQ